MLKETFYLNDVSADSVGIHLQDPMRISGAKRIVKKIHVPGRNGDLVFDTGAFDNRTGKVKCFAIDKNVESKMPAIADFLLKDPGYVRMRRSEDMDHFFMARIVNGPEIEDRMKKLNPFTIKFDLMPQKFLISGENQIAMTQKGIINNPTGFPSKPLLKIYSASGSTGKLNVGNSLEIDFVKSINGHIYYDCETQNAFWRSSDGIDKNENYKVSTNEALVIEPGNNNVSWSEGIDKVEIIPRWWTV